MLIPRMFEKQKKIIIFSGAGLDQPSGIKTFRDEHGLWNDHKISEICDERTWKKNFEKVHSFYNGLRRDLPTFQPNGAHHTIKRIINKYGTDNVFNITMNISDMFERVGTEVLHLHGELTKIKCEACGNGWDIGYNEFDIETQRCPKCDSLKAVRPNIVFFNGQSPMYSYLHRALDYLDHPDSIVVVIGTTGKVIDVDNMIKFKPCHKILVDIHEPIDINVKKFKDVFLNGALDGMIEVEKVISEKWD